MDQTQFRRGSRPTAKRNMLDGNGGVIRAGQSIPRGAIPTRDIDRLGRHGMVNRRKGDTGFLDPR